MKSFIFGYNLRNNLGDDLMLLSNLRFSKLYGCSEVYIIDWRGGEPKYNDYDLLNLEYQVLRLSPNLKSIFAILNISSHEDLFLIGGGNLFDNKKMGFFLFVLASLSAIFGRIIYLRGVGFGRIYFYSKYLSIFSSRFRDSAIKNSKPIIKDTASWYIAKLKNMKIKQSNEFDVMLVPRAIDDCIDRQQVKILSQKIKRYSKIIVCIMGDDNYFQEMCIYNDLLKATGDPSKFELYVYKNMDELISLMYGSKKCITLRLHVGILWSELFGFSQLSVIPYSNKHRYAFPSYVLDDMNKFSDVD